MKRKLALLMAAVMTMSLVPAFGGFAASTNKISKTSINVPKNAVLMESGALKKAGMTSTPAAVTVADNDDVKMLVDGTDLVLLLQDPVSTGQIINLSLENAVWFFREAGKSEKGGWGSGVEGYTKTFANGSITADAANTKIVTYTRNAAGLGSGKERDPFEVAYELYVTAASDKSARVTIKEDVTATMLSAADGYYALRIPMVVKATAEGDVRVTVNAGDAKVTGGTYLVAQANAASTTTYVNDPEVARDEFDLDRLIIKENRIGSLKPGEFTLTAPNGFEFKKSSETDGTVVFEADTTQNLGKKVSFKQVNGKDDRSVLIVDLAGLTRSTKATGNLYITGLVLVADENAKQGDIMVSIKENSKNESGVTNESFKAGERKEWDIILELDEDEKVPTLVNGRYGEVKDVADETDYIDLLEDADDDYHLTAAVRFAEGTENAWFSGRQTLFTLPEGVKFRKVEFYDLDNIDTDITTDIEGGHDGTAGFFPNNASKYDYVTINGSTMSLSNIKVDADEKAELFMDIWVSIESGFEGDVTLSVGGSAIPAQSNDKEVPSVVIAKAVSPIKVETKVTDLKIGYQFQTTADIVIKETDAAMLEKGKYVNVSVTDMVSTDMLFSDDTKVAVTKGDLKLTNINSITTSGGNRLGQGQSALLGSGGTISFEVDRASSEASEITISNVSVKVDRTVAETNRRPYKVVVWGDAVAANYVNWEYNKYAKDKFNTPGVMADYLKIVTSAEGNNVLSQEVKVTMGENYFVVDGVTYDMDAAAYISKASNSTMVPVRFISNAFGIKDDQVIWDDANKTVTIIMAGRVVQFTANQTYMLVDGTPVPLLSPDNLPVSAEITNERMYVPFRAMGDAFGVSVSWDAATQTAIYNAKTVATATAE